MNARPPKKSETLEVRISHEAKLAFIEACENRGVSVSEAVREFASAYSIHPARRLLNLVRKGMNMIAASLVLPMKAAAPAAAAVLLSYTAVLNPGYAPLDAPEAAPDARFVEAVETAPEPRAAMAQPVSYSHPLQGKGKQEAFDDIDRNSDSRLSLGEFYQAAGFTAEGRPDPVWRQELIESSVEGALESQPEGLINEAVLRTMIEDKINPSLENAVTEIRKTFDYVDIDGDGYVTFEEFDAASERDDWRD